MRSNSLLTLSLVAAMTLVGCGGGGGGTSTPDTIAPLFTTNDNVSIAENQINVITVHATDISRLRIVLFPETIISIFH